MADADETPLAQLKALFPEIDDEVLGTVLSSKSGSVEEATEALLAINDPDYQSGDTQPGDGTENDELLARQLANELEAEEREARRALNAAAPPSTAPPAQQQQQQQSRAGLPYQAYVPRKKARPGVTSPAGSSGSVPTQQQRQQQQEMVTEADGSVRPKDELDQITEQFGKLAEQGKKTALGLFSRIKDEISKFDAPAKLSSDPATGANHYPTGPPPQPPSKFPGEQGHGQGYNEKAELKRALEESERERIRLLKQSGVGGSASASAAGPGAGDKPLPSPEAPATVGYSTSAPVAVTAAAAAPVARVSTPARVLGLGAAPSPSAADEKKVDPAVYLKEHEPAAEKSHHELGSDSDEEDGELTESPFSR